MLQRNPLPAVECQRTIHLIRGVIEPSPARGHYGIAPCGDCGPRRSGPELTAAPEAIGERARAVELAEADQRLAVIRPVTWCIGMPRSRAAVSRCSWIF